MVAVLSLVASFWWFRFGPKLFSPPPKEQQITLAYWGVEREGELLKPVIEAYQKLHPNIKINYVKQSPINYRARLQTQLKAGEGPDIFRIHNSWPKMLQEDLSPAPESIMSLDQFNKTFYPVAAQSLTEGGKIWALPLEIDGLVLFYNSEILKGADVAVPKSWQEFLSAARKVTVKDQAGQIQTSGTALGTTNNVDFWPEILSMLLLQQQLGTSQNPWNNLENPATPAGVDVLRFYTGFITDPQNKAWDPTLASSTQMFLEGKLAFYFAPASKAGELKASSLALNFKVTPVPQLSARMVSYAAFWVEGVSKRSPHQKEAWEFLKYLTDIPSLRLINQQATSLGLSRLAYSRVDLSSELSGDPVLGAVMTQAPFYKSWYLNSQTLDSGINEEMIKVYEETVNRVLQGQDPLGVLPAATSGVKQVLEKYGINK